MINLEILFKTVCDDKTAVEFYQTYGIMPKVKLCKNRHEMSLEVRAGRDPRWRCTKSACRYDSGIRVGNWLEGSKIRLHKIVHFIYCWANDISNSKFCERELGIDRHSIVNYNHILREVCVWKWENTSGTLIGGDGNIVEISGCLLERKNVFGNLSKNHWYMMAICQETDGCVLRQAENGSPQTLLPLILECVNPGSVIITAEWEQYRNIIREEGDCLQGSNYTFIGARKEDNNNIGLRGVKFFSRWKITKGVYREKVKPNQLDTYLAEYIWRRKTKDKDPFLEIMLDISDYQCDACT